MILNAIVDKSVAFYNSITVFGYDPKKRVNNRGANGLTVANTAINHRCSHCRNVKYYACIIGQVMAEHVKDIIDWDILHIHGYFYLENQSYSDLGRPTTINMNIKQAE